MPTSNLNDLFGHLFDVILSLFAYVILHTQKKRRDDKKKQTNVKCNLNNNDSVTKWVVFPHSALFFFKKKTCCGSFSCSFYHGFYCQIKPIQLWIYARLIIISRLHYFTCKTFEFLLNNMLKCIKTALSCSSFLIIQLLCCAELMVAAMECC